MAGALVPTFVLLNLGETAAAIDILEAGRTQAARFGGALRAWPAAAHGEALAPRILRWLPRSPNSMPPSFAQNCP